MYCFCHCASFVFRVYYRCVYKHTVSVGGYCMTQKYRKSLPLPIHTILALVMVSLLASACALGGSSSNTTSATSTPSARPSNSHPVADREFFMQRGVPALPVSVAALVPEVLGLDNFAFPEFRPPFGLMVHSASFAGNCSKYGAKQTLTREKLAAAYQLDQFYQKGFQGQGMTIAVAEFGDTYNPRDIANYDTCAGIAPVSIQNIDVVGHLAPGPGEGEAALDLELISGLAPKAQILDYQAALD